MAGTAQDALRERSMASSLLGLAQGTARAGTRNNWIDAVKGMTEKADAPEYHDSAGRPLDAPAGPRGHRMAQLGILTRAQRRPPAPVKIRTGIDGKPNPGDMENAKLQGTLQQKYQERLSALQAIGPTNTVHEQDPMMRSQITRGPVRIPR